LSFRLEGEILTFQDGLSKSQDSSLRRSSG